ncbi:MAG: hypothetical protein HY057_07665 [Rhodospirillales bacterium]|nr:hypothetical protein [Rhodospirillales bacterium]
MIRLSTALWLLLAGLIGWGLFHLKYQVRALEGEYTRLNRQILNEQQALHVLRAEWSYINQPQRLAELARRHLDLQPMRPTQLGRLADVPWRNPDIAPQPAAAPPPPPAGKAPLRPVAAATKEAR